MAVSYWDQGDWNRLAEEKAGIISLSQGDLLPRCLVPVVPVDFGLGTAKIGAAEADLIVVTQSCDLANGKVAVAALCPVYDLATYETLIPDFGRKGIWEQVRCGRREGLHMLGGRDRPDDNREALVVDFRQIHSLPVGYLLRHAEGLGDRWRLKSPYLEHFSQAFARFFMRVGLPTAIPPFK